MVAGRDVCYDEEMAKAQPHDPVPIGAMDPLYLLYTSGTTGTPKVGAPPSDYHIWYNWHNPVTTTFDTTGMSRVHPQ